MFFNYRIISALGGRFHSVVHGFNIALLFIYLVFKARGKRSLLEIQKRKPHLSETESELNKIPK